MDIAEQIWLKTMCIDDWLTEEEEKHLSEDKTKLVCYLRK